MSEDEIIAEYVLSREREGRERILLTIGRKRDEISNSAVRQWDCCESDSGGLASWDRVCKTPLGSRPG